MVKQATTYLEAVEFLNYLFDLFNDRFFKNELIRPTITIQSSPKAYGHFTTRDDTWVSDLNGNSNEINIGAGTLSRPIENVCVTLIHEMTHYWNHIKGIKDTSNNNIYHNSRFKNTAEAHGLIVEQEASKRYGYTKCYPSQDLLDFIKDKGLKDIQINRNEVNARCIAKNSSSIKMVCECGNIVRATRAGLMIQCLECGELFRAERRIRC